MMSDHQAASRVLDPSRPVGSARSHGPVNMHAVTKDRLRGESQKRVNRRYRQLEHICARRFDDCELIQARNEELNSPQLPLTVEECSANTPNPDQRIDPGFGNRRRSSRQTYLKVVGAKR